MKIIIAPDKFKGTLTSLQFCEIVSKQIKSNLPNVEVLSLPIADGGDGSIDCLLTIMGGSKVTAKAYDAIGNLIDIEYGLTSDGVAIIEVAKVVGLAMLKTLQPMSTSTFGVGQLIANALDRGVNKFILCLGGSSTTDGGTGLAQALGVKFEGCDNIHMCGSQLDKITNIDIQGIDKRLKSATFTVMCDVDNTVYGEYGAAQVYSRQKGADDNQIKILDNGLQNLCICLQKTYGIDYNRLGGSGAAGALGAGCMAFCNAKLTAGIDVVLELAQFDRLLQDTDIVVTGEGRLDSQSLMGKAVGGVARRCKARNTPLIAIVGEIALDDIALKQAGFTAVVSSNIRANTLDKAKLTIQEDMKVIVDNLIKLVKLGQNI